LFPFPPFSARHEVKNGILAAIGLLDHLREGIAQEKLLREEWKAFAGMPQQESSRGRVVGGGGCLPGKHQQQGKLSRSFFDRSTKGGTTMNGTPPEYDTAATVAGKKRVYMD
jgi:hypothetical protein